MSYDLMFNKANELYLSGDFDNAELLYRNILEAVPENADVLNMLGLTAQAKNLHKQAVSYFLNAIKFAPKHLPLYFNLAVSYQNLEQYIQAIDAYNKVIELNPNIKETYNNIAAIYEKLNKPQKAIEFYNKAVSLDENYIEPLINIAVLQKDITKLEDLKLKFPQSHLPYYYLGLNYFNENNFSKALELISQADSIENNITEIKLLKAKIYFALEDIQSASENFYLTLKLNDKCVEAYVALANIENNEKYYLKALDLEPNNLQAIANYANLLYKQNRTLEALEEYRKAVILNPDLPEISNNLALILKDIGEYEQALDLMLNAFVKNKQQKDFWINMSETLVLLYQKDKSKAMQIAKQWQSLDETNVFANHIVASFEGKNTNYDNLYSQELFDIFAPNYDLTMQKINYAVLDKIAELNIDFNGNILDLGCGTGAFAEKFLNQNSKITGIDISQNMLNIANKKQCYHKLLKEDITDFLAKNTFTYDYVVALDVFEYIPDIKNIVSYCKNATMVFNIEKAPDNVADYILSFSGRHQHNPEYVKEILKNAGYTNIKTYALVLRKENDQPVDGVLFVANKN